MIRLQGKLPRQLYVAVSGGLDSMVALDFLRRAHHTVAVTFDHGSEYHVKASALVHDYCLKHDVSVIEGRIKDIEKPKDLSLEEYWRDERYAFFHKFDGTLVTAHHLDDVVETWLWSSCHGEGKLIPYANQNVIRPFRLTPKEELVRWADKHDVPYHEDLSNADTRFMRNYIRHNMVKHAFHVNPGLHKVLRKKLEEDFHEYTCKERLNSLVL